MFYGDRTPNFECAFSNLSHSAAASIKQNSTAFSRAKSALNYLMKSKC